MITALIEKNKSVQAIKNSFANDTAVHAYVIQAEETILADVLTYLSAIAVCGKFGCGECSDCLQALNSRHPDVFYYPQNGRKTMSVDDIKDILGQTQTLPTMGKNKAYIINAATVSAVQNWQGKLLKILEEPPQNNYFFIGVTNTADLFDTILSRAVCVSVEKLEFNQIKNYLLESGYSPYSAEICALMSDGNISAATELISESTTEGIYQSVANALKNMTSTKVSLTFVTDMSRHKAKYKLLLTAMEALFAEVVRFYDGITLLKENKDVTIIAQNYSREAALRCIELVENAYKELASYVNFNMVFDNLILKILEVRYICPK
ncbi:MAG TPA: hypothetical protein PK675_01820 [Clostridia bacterium]|nr:hypothetical protein [Clostridia bacterium]